MKLPAVQRLRRIMLASAVIAGQLLSVSLTYAQPVGYTPPLGLIPRSSSEYYSTAPNAQILIPVNIWGEVREPGIHYVVPGSSVLQSLSAAGGPLASASLPEVRLVSKEGVVRYIGLDDSDAHTPVSLEDTIVVERSFKQDMPLLFGGLSVLISVATLILVTKNQK